MNRRDFVARAGALLGAAGILPGCAARRPLAARGDVGGPHNPFSRVGVQLYSLRMLMERDPAGTISAIAKAGFDEVEFAGFYGRSAAEMRALIDRHALTSPAGHVSIDDLRARLPRLIADARTLGWHWLIVPWIDPKERTAAGYRAIAKDFNRAGGIAAESGVKIGFHAEDYDFKPLPDGTVLYDILIGETDPALVDLELDLYWITKAGGDPLKYLAAYPGRFPLLHIKDITADGRMANAGDGVIDFPTIVAAARRGGTKHFIIENDEPPHPIEDVTAGMRYLRPLLR